MIDTVEKKTRRKHSYMFQQFLKCLKENQGVNMICEQIDISSAQFGSYLSKAYAYNKSIVRNWNPKMDKIKFRNLPICFKYMIEGYDDTIDDQTIVTLKLCENNNIILEIEESEDKSDIHPEI